MPMKQMAFVTLFAASAVSAAVATSHAGSWFTNRGNALSCVAPGNPSVHVDGTGAYNASDSTSARLVCPVVPAATSSDYSSSEYLSVYVQEGGTTTPSTVSACVTFLDVLGMRCEDAPVSYHRAGTRFSGLRTTSMTASLWTAYKHSAAPYLQVRLAPRSMLKGWINTAWQ
jgi:hypothetical protein